MSLYTFILDFAGGTYISQVDSPSARTGCVKWAEGLDTSGIKGIGKKNKQSLIDQMKEEEPQPLDGLHSAWCVSATLRGGMALINIVQTESAKEKH